MNKKFKLYFILIIIIIINIFLYTNLNNYFLVLEKCFNNKIDVSPKIYSLICFIITLISIFIIIDIILITKTSKTENKGIIFKSEDGTYGTANWMNEKEMGEILSFEKPGIILGKYHEKRLRLPFDCYFNKNICVFGSSGSMKTIRICFN